MASVRDRGTSFQVRHAGRSRSFPYHNREERKQAEFDARQWGFEQERRDRLGAQYESPPESLGLHLDEFIAFKKASGLKPKSIENLETEAKRLGTLRERLIPSLRAREVKRLLAVQGPGRTTSKALALLKTVLRESEQTFDQAILNIKAPKYESREAQIVTLKQLRELSSFMPEFVKRIVTVAGLTGLRQGELFDLKVSDLDLDGAKLHVRKGKTDASTRTVHLSAEPVRLLREQLVARPPSTSHLVFPNEQGERWDKTRFMREHFHHARYAAGLEGFQFHDLRRTFASLMILAGVDVRTIAAEMGHVDGGALLLRRYGYLYDGAGERAAAKLDALVEAR